MAKSSSSPVISAYMQLVPKLKSGSLDAVKSDVAGGMGGAGTKSGESFGSGFMGKLKTVVSVAAIAEIGKTVAGAFGSAISEYADYEQLVGGVETLFGDSADTVKQYAQGAFETAGLNANDYMETVTGFSASLLQSLDGDTSAAAEYANLAITDMSDNANKMGTDMESIQNAYQGFAKQNYTMLDNLQIGYSGTKSEMERLIADANELRAAHGETADLTIDSYADIVTAIHEVQTEMGITGTTAKEAKTTISGSMSATKAAFDNLVVGIAGGSDNLGELVGSLVDNVGVTIGNIAPIVGNILDSSLTLVQEYLPVIISSALDFVAANAPAMVSAGISFFCGIISDLPTIISSIVSRIPEIVWSIVCEVTSPGNLSMMADAGMSLITGLGEGIVNGASWVVDQVFSIGDSIISAAKDVLGIHSPSTVFRSIGEYTMEGFEQGISSRGLAAASQMAATSRGMALAGAAGAAATTTNYSINGLSVTGDRDMERAVLTIMNGMRRRGAMA